MQVSCSFNKLSQIRDTTLGKGAGKEQLTEGNIICYVQIREDSNWSPVCSRKVIPVRLERYFSTFS